ncbi:MAG: Tat pathway signal protein [Rhizobacter sp.]|nr:Tat pathway signal protein [Chlorobiales bacterium]
MDTAAYRPSAADLAFLDTLERRSFDFFWETTDPKTGLVPDRYPTRAFSSIAAIGFGLSCYLVGAERGYITREQARDRVETTLTYLWRLPQSADKVQTAGYKGFFYHFLRYENGLRYRDTELSSIDTALLLAGILSCQTYFDRDDSSETNIRMVADSIYRRVEWTWMTTKPPVVSMGWHPENGSQKGGKFIDSNWDGYDEAMILYVLALGSPTFAPDSTVWKQWTEPYVWGKFYGGEEHVNFSPLFGHQYSHVWIDFRGIQDDYMQAKGTNYFENSRRATYANRAYCLANPMQWRDYGDSLWGLTACDGPADTSFVRNGKPVQFHSYWARGASLLEIHDDGTLAPTAAGGSVPFAPEICIPALRGFEAKYGEKFFKRYGFLDAINPSYAATDTGSGWIDVDYLGIDQGPIVLMLENYRSEFVWKLMQRNPYIRRGLMRAGFQGGWL